MRWVTPKRIHVNRTATAWLIQRFLDPAAEILFVEPGDVAEVQRRAPEAGGLWAISQGFTDVARDDHEIVARAAFLYDSLYAHLQRLTATSRPPKGDHT